MKCKCAGDVEEVEFGIDAFRGVEKLDVTAIQRGADSVLASTATGTLKLRRMAGGALDIQIDVMDTVAGRATAELLAAGQPVYARPLWDAQRSKWLAADGTARVSRAWFQYILVRPVPKASATGIDPLTQ